MHLVQEPLGLRLAERPATAIRLVDAPGIDVNALRNPAPGPVDHAFKERGPHVQLHLFGHAHVLVEQLGQPVAAPGPGLDAEREAVVLVRRELDLSCFQMALQSGQAERRRAHGHHPYGPVPGTGYAYRELVARLHSALASECLREASKLTGHRPVGIGAHERHELLGGEGGASDGDPVAAMEERAHAVLDQLNLVM